MSEESSRLCVKCNRGFIIDGSQSVCNYCKEQEVLSLRTQNEELSKENERAEREIVLYKQYIELLSEPTIVNIAMEHGWVASEEYIQRGKEIRAELKLIKEK